MTSVQTSKLIAYPWQDLFDLVADVKRYPQFVPHCRALRVLSHRTDEAGKTVVLSRMTVGISAIEVGYANRTVADAVARRIDIEAVDGPLRHLRALWRFEPQDDAHTRVHFSADYEFNSRLLTAVASRAFGAMLAEIPAAFERRAARLLHSATRTAAVWPPAHSLPAVAPATSGR